MVEVTRPNNTKTEKVVTSRNFYCYA